MAADEPCWLPAIELATLIAAGETSPVEVVEAVLSRIDASQPGLNAFITVCHDGALAAAREAEAALARGDPPGPLHGVPFSVKDLVNTAGVRTTFGSLTMADNVPTGDSLTVARLKAAGAILIGKTTTPEFGHKPLTEGPLFGRTANPWSAGHTAGGSSGGAAAAAAAGLAPLALGTDGGGSIRIPAACCGVVGLKASLGRIPHDQAADIFGNLTYMGPITRTVADSALMLQIMAGPDPCDPFSLGLEEPDFQAAADGSGDLTGLRLAWRPYLGNTAIEPEILAMTEACLPVFEDLGARVEAQADDFTNTEPTWLVITHSVWASRFQHLVAQSANRMDPSLLAQVGKGNAYSAVELQDAARLRSELFRQVQGWFEDHDLIVMPTLTRTAVPIDSDPLGQVEIAGQAAGSLRAAWYPYTHPFNLTGHPAMTLPCGFAANGLPVGLQLVAPWHGEARLLRAAALFEAARPWAQRRPDLPL
ncbi:MAG: amidase family protein [Alphaproteobacteria bacterium]|nr:amidase family protein [Alphaproteobacteria bacterium]MDP6811744.1 amidase family protein [Alphaproteobacteria bacterium]